MRADLERSGLFRGLEVPPLAPHPNREHARQLRRMALAARRRAGAGLGRSARRRPLRGPLPRLRHREAGAARRHRLRLHQGQRARGGAPHRRFRLREAHRREGRVLHPDRLRGASAARATSCRSPTPTASARSTCCARTSRSSRRSGRPRAGASPTSRSRSKKPVVYVHHPGRRTSARWWRASRARTRRRPGRPTARPSRWCSRSTAARSSSSSMPTAAAPRRRISNSSSIDTEPRYSTDGKWIYFTSDRGGSPQIYRMAASGGEPQRVTFEGSYNVSPRPSPDGRVARLRDAQRRQVPGGAAGSCRTNKCRSSPTATATSRRASPPTAG